MFAEEQEHALSTMLQYIYCPAMPNEMQQSLQLFARTELWLLRQFCKTAYTCAVQGSSPIATACPFFSFSHVFTGTGA